MPLTHTIRREELSWDLPPNYVPRECGIATFTADPCTALATEYGSERLSAIPITASGSIYRLGLALFDLERPVICLQRGDSWMFAPEAAYERSGDVKDVVFPCGQTIAGDGDTINLYYGAADSTMALAMGSMRSLLSWLDKNSSPQQVSTQQRGVGNGARRV
jgi:glycosyl hydrolase family 130 (putative beta-1,4-mannooligosaccharide phosphorylase)